MKNFIWEFISLDTERRTDVATRAVIFREMIWEIAWKLLGVPSAPGETRIQINL